MKTINAFKTEKRALTFSLITIILIVNIALLSISYLDMMRSARFAISDIKQEIEHSIEKNENIAAALGDLIALPDDKIVAKLGDSVNLKEFESDQSQYQKNIVFTSGEMSRNNRKTSALLQAFWSNLSDENKAPHWTYFTSTNLNYTFDFKAVYGTHHKYSTPHLNLGTYFQDLSKKINAEKEFLVSDRFYSSVYQDALTGLPVITFSVPVISNNLNFNKSKVEGVISTDYTSKDLITLFDKSFTKAGITASSYQITLESLRGGSPIRVSPTTVHFTPFPTQKISLTPGYFIKSKVGIYNVVHHKPWLFIFSNLILLVFLATLLYAYRNIMNMMKRLSYDSLTRAFSREGGEVIINSMSAHESWIIVAVDLDLFKEINDNYGHHVGDLSLAFFSDTLHKTLRASDSIIRMGGDEFLLLLPWSTYSAASALMQRAQKLLKHFKYDGISIPISCSYGIQEFTGDFAQDCQIADEKLYIMKNRPTRTPGRQTPLETTPQQVPERDPDTGLLTLTGLRNHPETFKDRSIMMLIHLSNHSSLTNLLGPEYGKSLMDYLISRISMTFPEDIILCRERVDKLVVILPPVRTLEQLGLWEHKASTLFTLQEVSFIEQHELRIEGNAGLVQSPLTPDTFDTALRNSGVALHHARKQGNAKVTVFTPDMHAAGLHHIQLHEQLNFALEREEFRLVMQPIVGLEKDSECREGECLIRWNSKVLGNVPPDEFIPIAEETGLIIPLGEWIINSACRELAKLIARGASEDFKLHINISPLQLQANEFAEGVIESLKQHGLHGQNLCIEITEGVLIGSGTNTCRHLKALREVGVTIALDDFGSGYSSLSYLHTLPFDQLKIDRQFVSGVLADSRSESVIDSVLNLSQSFGVPMVAEGIEDQETGDKLRAMGCLLAQGYHYGRPKPFNEWPVHNGQITL
ncbi:EAL domain-containing protein [Enterobacteriaceae bacterium RIT691]|nr:EAL domain-containing protein [Enterobacteriaceae bacterium RIT691]